MQAAGLLLRVTLLISAATVSAQTSENTADTLPGAANNPSLLVKPQAAATTVAPDEQDTADGNRQKSNDRDNQATSAPESTPGVSPADPVQQTDRRRPDKLTTAIEKFTPTEEIKVDNAVPFPVDI